MSVRDVQKTPPAVRSEGGRALVVMVCDDMREAERVGRQLQKVDTGCLVAYRLAAQLRVNVPAGKVSLVILATADGPESMGATLRWLRRRWPRCPITVVGDEGCGIQEIVARTGGAAYMTRPVSPEQWLAVLAHALLTQPMPV